MRRRLPGWALAGLGGLGVGVGCAQVAGLSDIQIAGTGGAGAGTASHTGTTTGATTSASTGGSTTASSSSTTSTTSTTSSSAGGCAAMCTDPCSSCTLPGLVGTCAKVPNGVATPQCSNAEACIQGACQPLQGRVPVGSTCNSFPSQCVNDLCVAGYCKLAVNDPCNQDIECSTGWCSGNRCTKCLSSVQCASMSCRVQTGECLFPQGAFCSSASDCADGSCQGGVCRRTRSDGAICATSYDCQSYDCQGTACTACTVAECASCNLGICLAPSGTSCHTGAECNSGQCTGTAPYTTCQ